MLVTLASRPAGRCAAVLALVAGLALGGCSAAGYTPPDMLDPPAAELTRAMASFAANTRKDYLAGYRRDVRRDLFVATLRDLVTTPDWDSATLGRLAAAEPPTDFLCRPRYAYQRIALRVGNIEAVGAALSDRLQAPDDHPGALIGSLGQNYTIATDAKEAPPSYDAWLGGEEGKNCATAVQTGDPFLTRSYVGKEFAAAAIPASLVLIDTLWAVVRPVVVGQLQAIDIERRNAAIRAYFADPANVEALKRDLAGTESYLEKEFRFTQRRAAGRAATAAAILFDPAAPHWAKIREITESSTCRSALTAMSAGETTLTAENCLGEALTAASAPLAQALDAGDALDAALERQLPADRLSAEVDTLRDIALGKAPDDAKLRALWSTTVHYVALYQSTDDAASAINQMRLGDRLFAR